jgi:NADH:ubiquinone oxidoreductase subunit D
MDLPDGWIAKLLGVMRDLDEVLADVKGLVANNRIFQERTQNVGIISQEDALSHGMTGPCLRATGIPLDVRKAQPYWGYENYDFEVPTGEGGDTFDRIMVRFDEIEQSRRIILQAAETLPGGAWMVEDHLVALPEKDQVYNSMEALINHFKLVMHGISPPRGEVYSPTEGGNGELGFYIVSDGSPIAWRVRIRPPCFANYSAFPKMARGGLLSDLAATLGSINVIAGELDR